MAEPKTAIATDEVERPTWIECQIPIQIDDKLIRELRFGSRSGVTVSTAAGNWLLVAEREEFGKLIRKVLVEKEKNQLTIKGFQIPGISSTNGFTPALLQEAIEQMLTAFATFNI